MLFLFIFASVSLSQSPKPTHMKNRFITLFLASLIGLLPVLAQQMPHWQKHGSATQLMVDNRPYLILGGELGNSSASSLQDIDRIFPKLKRTGLNTVLVPAYWDLIEAEEGTFDFSLVDHKRLENRLSLVRRMEKLYELLCPAMVQARLQEVPARTDSDG